MKNAVKLGVLILLVIIEIYLTYPSPIFPKQGPDFLQSTEPADVETPFRRAYFTDFTREEVIDLYKEEFGAVSIMGLRIPQFRLNYPPEDSQILIRDQTRSTFLEELVHPLRESIFINGFEPKNDKDVIIVSGKKWRQKIIIKYVPGSVVARVSIGVFVVGAFYLLLKLWGKSLIDFKNSLFNWLKSL